MRIVCEDWVFVTGADIVYSKKCHFFDKSFHGPHPNWMCYNLVHQQIFKDSKLER